MASVRSNVAAIATVALACAAAYYAVILLLGTGEAVANVLDGARYAMAAFLVLLSAAVFTGAGAVIWLARRDGHSWWRAARRASVVLILGTYGVGVIHVMIAAPFF